MKYHKWNLGYYLSVSLLDISAKLFNFQISNGSRLHVFSKVHIVYKQLISKPRVGFKKGDVIVGNPNIGMLNAAGFFSTE